LSRWEFGNWKWLLMMELLIFCSQFQICTNLNMDFSDYYKYNGTIVYSPNSAYFACTDNTNIIVRDSHTLAILAQFYTLDTTQSLLWSPDSQYLLAAQYKRKVVQCFSLQDPSWVCKVDENLAGLSWAAWSPDSRHILTCTEYQLRLTVWSLLKKHVTYIKYPKFNTDSRGIHYSNNNMYLAVAERKEFKDYINIYSAADNNYELIKNFPVETEDLVDFRFSPDDRYIAIADTNLEYNIVIYSVDGRKLMKYSAYEQQLGVKGIQWAPNSRFLAVASYDESIRIFTENTWKLLIEYQHNEKLIGSNHNNVIVYKEVLIENEYSQFYENKENNQIFTNNDTLNDSIAVNEAENNTTFRTKLQQIKGNSTLLNTKAGKKTAKPSIPAVSKAKSISSTLNKTQNDKVVLAQQGIPAQASKYIVIDAASADLSKIKADSSDINPKLGCSIVEWSADSRYLLSRNDAQPNLLWIWSTSTLSLACLLVQLSPIKQAKWHPTRSEILLCANNNKLYVWRPEGAAAVEIPNAGKGFECKKIEWNGSGTAIIAADKTKFCAVFLNLENSKQQQQQQQATALVE
jgi:WD40 repeat protein